MTEHVKGFVDLLLPAMRRDSSGFIIVKVVLGQWSGEQNVTTVDGVFFQVDIDDAVVKARASLTKKLTRATDQLAEIEDPSILKARDFIAACGADDAPDDFDAQPF